MKKLQCISVLLLCVLLFGCAHQPKSTLASYSTTRDDRPILSTRATTVRPPMTATSVVATVFENTVILARSPVLAWGDQAPVCTPKDISQGGRIGGEDEDGVSYSIVRVIIVGDLVPVSTRDWFRDLPMLVEIRGMNQIHTDLVTDMSNMFNGCTKLTAVDADSWNVENVENMLGIFDGCDALSDKPDWYQE